MNIPNPVSKFIGIIFGLIANASPAHAEQWPELPTEAFLTGRPATQTDVDEGRAIFVLAAGGVPVGKPIPISIPQYALLNGEGSKPPIPVVVVQAEEFPKGKLVGVRDARGKEYVVQLSDLKLLGKSQPKQTAP
jgi:hypothetical protein